MLPLPWFELKVSLVIGGCAGFLMHRSDFCMTRAFRDLFLFRSLAMLRPLLLLVVASALLFETGRLMGILPYYPFPWFGPPALTSLAGGVLFGLGMVLAGGCVVGVLYKMGAGSLLAAIAFVGLLVGSALYAELHSWWIGLAGASRLAGDARTVAEWLGVAPWLTLWPALIAGTVVCWLWWRTGRLRSGHAAEGFIPPWQSALALAGLSLLSVLLIGLPMGVTTSYAKLAASLESLVAPAHVAGLTFFSAQPISYTFPLEQLPRVGGAGPVFDVVAMIQVPLIVGIVAGSALSAGLLGELRLNSSLPPRQVGMVFVGGVVMALGSRMTPGCNLWHIMGGLPLLTLQSLLFVAGLFPGAWLGSLLLRRVVM
ncbi:MAG: YeeE/YedE thiosulfate transporter family protein [Desulfuromonadales bacterium]|nr:YeeE/YedE thiosulfate transporter family protein [Desulfuromonadales bacterium]